MPSFHPAHQENEGNISLQDRLSSPSPMISHHIQTTTLIFRALAELQKSSSPDSFGVFLPPPKLFCFVPCYFFPLAFLAKQTNPFISNSCHY